MKKTKFTATCRYFVDYTNLRSYKFKTCSVKHSFQVSVPVVSKDEFPLVFTVKDYETRMDNVTKREDIHKDAPFKIWSTPVRAFGKSLYKPLRFRWGSFVGAVIKDFAYVPKPEIYDNAEYDSIDKFGQENPNAKVNKDTKAATVAKYRNYAAKEFVIYRGEFWQRCDEPRYSYTKFGLPGDGTGFFIEYMTKPLKAVRKFYFSALERQHAIDVVSKIAESYRDETDSIRHTKRNIVVHMPEYVTPIKK